MSTSHGEDGPPSTPLAEGTALAVLRAVRRAIRSRTRAPGYWAAAERFSLMWLGEPLCATSEYLVAAGPDLAIIDSLYEEAMASGDAVEALPDLTRRLQEMVELESASRELRRYSAGLLDTQVDLVEAARAIIATLTVHGYSALHGRGAPALASRWLAAWADAMGRQNLQQQRVCELGVLARLPPEERARCMTRLGLTHGVLVPESTSFSEGAGEFLDRYGETSAAPVAVLGCLPFSALPIDEVDRLLRLCVGEAGLLPAMSRLFRLAQDVSFDPAEPMNVGVFASAAEQRRSVLEVIADGDLSKPDLDEKLRKEWALHSARTRRAFERTLTEEGQGAGSETLALWLDRLFQVLDRLVPGTWKTAE